MVIGGVSTVLVNGNPLLRFDGYYVLSDVLEVPNLAQRGTSYLGWLLNRYAFAVPALRPFRATIWERAVMLAYAPLAWCYRMVVMVGVAVFIATHYFIVGVAMAVVTAVTAVLWPLVKSLWQVAAGVQYRGCRGRAVGLTFGAIAAAALLLLAVPAPLHSTAEGVIWLPPDSIVRAGADGFVRGVAAVPGQPVRKGDTLFTLVHPIEEARLQVQAAKVDELAAKYAAEWVTDRIAAAVTGFELAQESAALERQRARIAQHVIVAPSDGVFSSSRPTADMAGRYVKLGDIVGHVTPASGRIARVVVPQADIGLVTTRLVDVMIRLADRRTDLRSEVVRAVPAAADELPSQALTTANGGQISADPRDSKGLRSFEKNFQFDVSLPDEPKERSGEMSGFGSRVFVRFDYRWEPLGELLYRRIRQGLLSRFET